MVHQTVIFETEGVFPRDLIHRARSSSIVLAFIHYTEKKIMDHGNELIHAISDDESSGSETESVHTRRIREEATRNGTPRHRLIEDIHSTYPRNLHIVLSRFSTEAARRDKSFFVSELLPSVFCSEHLPSNHSTREEILERAKQFRANDGRIGFRFWMPEFESRGDQVLARDGPYVDVTEKPGLVDEKRFKEIVGVTRRDILSKLKKREATETTSASDSLPPKRPKGSSAPVGGSSADN